MNYWIIVSWVANFLIGALGIYVFYQVKKLPDLFADKFKMNKEQNFAKEMQVDNFYRQSNSSNMQDVMKKWMGYASDIKILTDLKGEAGIKKLTDLSRDTMLYGSEKSIKLMAVMFQQSYSTRGRDSTTDEGLKMWVNMAMIAMSLKADFTGIDVDPLEMLKVRLNDYTENESKLKLMVEEIEREIK